MSVLGIDVSKRTLDVALMFEGKTLVRRFDNTPKGFRTLQAWLGSLQLREVHACLERRSPPSGRRSPKLKNLSKSTLMIILD
jgi:hypothetical protein